MDDYSKFEDQMRVAFRKIPNVSRKERRAMLAEAIANATPKIKNDVDYLINGPPFIFRKYGEDLIIYDRGVFEIIPYGWNCITGDIDADTSWYEGLGEGFPPGTFMIEIREGPHKGRELEMSWDGTSLTCLSGEWFEPYEEQPFVWTVWPVEDDHG